MTPMLRTALTACAAIAGALVAPCTALGGSYVARACSPGTSAGLWAPVNTGQGVFVTGNECGGPEIGPLDASRQGSLYAEDIPSSPAYVPNGSRAGWTFTAPPGATIAAISYYRTLGTHFDRDLAAGLFTASGQVLEQCRIQLPFGSSTVCSMPNNQAPVVFSNLGTTSLFFGVLCDIVTQGTIGCSGGGATLRDALAYMYSSAVTVSENSVPVVSNVGGALWGGGLVSGTVAVRFSASDNTGIREHAVQDGSGRTIVSTLLGCDYGQVQPCPQSPDATLDVDTTRVADGARVFALVVTDAATNRTVVMSPLVIVDNLGPPPPVGLTATASQGSDAVALRWANPPDAPAPVTMAMAQLCSMSCAPAVAVSASGSAQLTAPGPGVYTARVWLLDTAGRGGPHNAASAVLTVPPPSSPPAPGAPPGTNTRIGAILKGRRLRVSGPIAASGRVTVSWRSKVGGRTVGHGSRVVTSRGRRVRVTFVIARAARTRAATIRVVVRSGRRVVGQARARRG